MAENVAPVSVPGAELPGAPFYEKSRVELKKLIHEKRRLEAELQAHEDLIYKKETDYFEDTPSGNIITGFEAYTKGTGAAPGAARRKGQITADHRVFSSSSITYNADAAQTFDSAQSTPMAAMAPTPLSTSFQKGESASNHATPTSATSSNRAAAAGANGGSKKNKKPADEDDEDDRKDTKKIRTASGAVRK
ncbi:Chromatin modification-related protein eaf6 [Phlyctema vagabunda]|uniref:Chromatin modification-related protein EAF6 n=1 Tax=Phlyctema vagabunda TaxID=108571 RepID=A0ABR4PJT9_9HELO